GPRASAAARGASVRGAAPRRAGPTRPAAVGTAGATAYPAAAGTARAAAACPAVAYGWAAMGADAVRRPDLAAASSDTADAARARLRDAATRTPEDARPLRQPVPRPRPDARALASEADWFLARPGVARRAGPTWAAAVWARSGAVARCASAASAARYDPVSAASAQVARAPAALRPSAMPAWPARGLASRAPLACP